MLEMIVISKNGKGYESMLSTFERMKRKKEKIGRGRSDLEMERGRLIEENKRSEPIITFYRHKLRRSKECVERGLNGMFDGKEFVLVGELNTI
jgi:hypothetical protein